MKLTLKAVATIQLPPGKSDHVEWDDDIAGFGLRLREGGARTWIYRYRIGTQQRSIALGNAKSVPLAIARANAGQLEARVRLGEDPAKDKETARIEAGNTVGKLIDQYLDERKDEWRPNSLREIKRHLLVYATPLHKLSIGAVSQREVANLLSNIAKSSGEATSHQAAPFQVAELTLLFLVGSCRAAPSRRSRVRWKDDSPAPLRSDDRRGLEDDSREPQRDVVAT
jgi:hypothetical protein